MAVGHVDGPGSFQQLGLMLESRLKELLLQKSNNVDNNLTLDPVTTPQTLKAAAKRSPLLSH